MNKRKIFNDPVYGFLYFPYEILYELIDHPYFQRLRRISQLGLTQYVYPGALHTRFHHALGAVQLMIKSIDTLRIKGTEISEEEAEAVCIAILLHDIGHGPFSHALEHKVVNTHHEDISIKFMEALNAEMDGRLSLAISIFKDAYSRKFLHQLVSSQLDMDRLDYLTRDSFYTGVAEGVIGYDRIIKMLNVINDQIVVEEKGIYSIEKFLVSRRIMYWQVYLHKTVIAAEQMLIRFWDELKKKKDGEVWIKSLPSYLAQILELEDFTLENSEHLDLFSKIDDFDIIYLLKSCTESTDFVLQYLSKSLINRKLFHIITSTSPFNRDEIEQLRHKTVSLLNVDELDTKALIIDGSESNLDYNASRDEIRILTKNGETVSFHQYSDLKVNTDRDILYYLCYPKYVNV